MKNPWAKSRGDNIAQEIDRWSDPPPQTFWAKWVGGIFIPLLLTGYTAHAIILKTATMPGRGACLDLHGTDAVLFDCTVLSLAFFLHTHYFWGNQERLAKYSEGGKILALLSFCIFYATLLYRLFHSTFSI